jgi:hypothetical protein
MKLKFTNQRNEAWTRVDAIVLILILGFLALLFVALFYAGNPPAKRRSAEIQCINNLKQIALAARIWQGDNNNRYPMSASATNGAAMELISSGDVAAFFKTTFQAMSNELSITKILVCPADIKHKATKSFQDFNNSHISYFVNPDASETYPQMIMFGDDNLTMDGVPVKSGILNISSPSDISWTPVRHGHLGNIVLADGSISAVSSHGFQTALEYSTNGAPFITNRLAIP